MFYRDLMSTLDVFDEIDWFNRQIDRTFRDVVTPVRSSGPTMNAWQKDDEMVLTLELPGYEAGDIDLTLEENVVTIKGSRKPLELKDGEQFVHRERTHGKFERNFGLPFGVDSEKIDARFDNGILTVTLVRSEADKPKAIQIKTR